MRILSPYIMEWDEKAAGHWDTAVRGSSALRAQIARSLDLELADFEELFIIHFLWDLRKFYDSVRIAKLIARLQALGYPPFLLILGLIAHKAPRILMVGHCCSDVIEKCGRSMLAGCQQSVSWARGLMHKLVEALGYVLPGSICFEHVDDLSHILACKSRRQLYDAAIEVGRLVKKGTIEADLILSEKSNLTSNCKDIAKAVVQLLNGENIQITLANTAVDVGIEVSAGTRRCVATQNTRIRKGGARAANIKKLVAIDSRALKLAPTGVAPQQGYGHEAQGSAPSQVTLMRRNMKRATPMGNSHSCLTTTIEWYYGLGKDPFVSTGADQIGQWFDLWSKCDDDKTKRIRLSWSRKVHRLARHPNKWSQAKGPISATICTIVDAGWIPSQPDCWIAPNGSWARLTKASLPKPK